MDSQTPPPHDSPPMLWDWLLVAATVGLAAALSYPWGYALITGMLVGVPDARALRLLAILFGAFAAATIAVASRRRLRTRRGAVAIAALLVFALASLGIVLLRVADTPVKLPATILYVCGSLTVVWLCAMALVPRSWMVRGAILGVFGAALAAFLSLVRVDGLSGGAQVVFGWRLAPLPTSLPATVAAPPASPTVLDPGPDDFPSYLGPRRDGRLDRPLLARDWTVRPPEEVWRRRVGPGWGGFAVAGGAAITQEDRGGREAVVCYDLVSGTERWIHSDPVRFDSSLGGPGPRATPTIAAGRIYTVGATGRLNCLAADGSVLWSVDTVPGAISDAPAAGGDAEPADTGELLPHGMAGSPLVVDGRVYVCPCGRDGKSLAAFDAGSGAELFRAGEARAGYSSPTRFEAEGGWQVLVFNGRGCAAHDPASGAISWSFPWTNDARTNCAQPVVDGTSVLLSCGYGTGSVLLGVTRGGEGDAWKVVERWRSRDLKSKFATPVLGDGVVYGLDDGILAAIDLETGRRRWKRGRYGHGQLLFVGDLLLVQTETGPVVLVDPRPEGPVELGTIQCLADKTWNTLALSGNLLLVRNSVEAACYRLPLEPAAAAAAADVTAARPR